MPRMLALIPAVAVVKHGDVVRKAMDQPDLVGCQGSARRGDNIFYSALVHGNHVCIPFYKKAAVLAHDGLFGEIDSVQFFAFMIDFRLGRVDVFHLYVFRGSVQHASAEGHDFSRKRMDRKYDTPQKRSFSDPSSFR